MKKTISLVLALLMVLSLCAFLVSCGSKSEDDLVGMWHTSYRYDGVDIDSAIIFESDGTYGKLTYRDGQETSPEIGTYEVDGNKVYLYHTIDYYNGGAGGQDATYSEYKFNGNCLKISGHKYVRMN